VPLLVFIVIALIIASYAIVSANPQRSKINFNKKVDMCNDLAKDNPIDGPFYSKLCLAMINFNDRLCAELDESNAKNCKDAFYVYHFYRTDNIKYCKSIYNINLREYCLELSEKSCNYYFGYGDYCNSILGNNQSSCEKQKSQKNPIIEDCQDNFYMHYAITKNPDSCSKIRNNVAKILCEVITK